MCMLEEESRLEGHMCVYVRRVGGAHVCVCERRSLGWRGTCVCMLEEVSRLEGHMCVYVGGESSLGWRGTGCVCMLEEESRLEGHMCVYVRGGV